MDQSIAYLHEVLSNYTEENKAVQHIDHKIEANDYRSERQFVEELSQGDVQMLRQILLKEMHHANQAGDHERGYQLNEVYELLY
ncbi:sporulation protein [Aquibacillus salsiterrae]|uniref:Sigma-G-dependent sporulation-specific acid-soluble spore protein CsgA n=1 Tax=Aquibacillus salsiterrae TaxID=2950439 RepID=A0A9X3WF24_9BACI|nr:sporulation protein [Aquibacillus salsiterrae]MDC3416234.1 sigma-G-dependent sporulation-specific acid-soluble spore protein CsgA [Aquibacillus salsiterrae]